MSRWWHLVFLFDLMNSCILPRLQSYLSLVQVWKIPGVESSKKKKKRKKRKSKGVGMCDRWLHSLLCQNDTYLPPTLVRNNLGNKFIPMGTILSLGLMPCVVYAVSATLWLLKKCPRRTTIMLVFGLSLVAQGISRA